jgi:hypothetical protein
MPVSDFDPIDLEDFLGGIVSLPKELSRLCVNCVTQGNYDLPLAIAAFVSELYSAFQMLNLRNDALRKRYDAIKYELQKIEEVVYDIRVRGLAGKTSSSTAAAPSAADAGSAMMQP